MTPLASERPHGRTFSWRYALAATVLLALAWYLRHPLMLVFGGVLVAALLHALARPLMKVIGGRERAALALVLAALVALVAAGLWWLGDPIMKQMSSLGAALPEAWEAVRNWLDGSTLGSQLLAALRDLSPASLPLAQIANMAEATVGAFFAALVVLVMGVYLAFDVGLYRRGMVRLLPLSQRPRLDGALQEAGESLIRWLVGRGVTMLAVGLLTTGGLYLLGMPLAVALGLIAGVLEFVPFFGPIAAGLLATLVAFAQGPQTALYVALLFLVIQQLEGNLLTPMAQRWAIHLPPMLTVAAVLVFGKLFGLLGIVLGTPLMVVTMVLVRRLWVEQTLEGRPT